MARRGAPVRRVRPRITYKWCGKVGSFVVRTPVALGLSNIPVLCASLGDSQVPGDVTIERILLTVSMRRILPTSMAACNYFVAIQVTDPSSGNPADVLNAQSTAQDAFQWGNRDILTSGALPVPAVIFDAAAGDEVVGRDVQVTNIDYKGRRKLYRLNHVITFTPVADVDSVLQMFFTSRTLLRYT